MSEIGIGTIVFGNWKIVELIGRGSFGSVYKIEKKKAYESSSGVQEQYAALKVIYIPKDPWDVKRLRNMGMDNNSIRQYYKDSTDRICREIDVMDPLKGHGNIVTYDDYDIIPQEDGTGSIILIKMELLTPINDYVLKNVMDEAHTVQLGIDLCQALEACEVRSIIHRDIKPDNIFVSNFGSFKLGDFGIARTADGTTSGTMTGTYGYMAPEVLSGKYNATVDIYSLGLVLYQYLNKGRLPFLSSDGRNVTLKEIETASADRLAGKMIPPIDGIRPELNRIISRACAFRPEERYQSATEFKNALMDYQKKYGLSIHRREQRKSTEDLYPTVLTQHTGNPGNPSYGRPDDFTTVQSRANGGQAAAYNNTQNRNYAPEYTAETVQSRPGGTMDPSQTRQSRAAEQGPLRTSGTDRFEQRRETEPNRKVVPIIAGCAAVAVLVFGGFFVWKNVISDSDGGTQEAQEDNSTSTSSDETKGGNGSKTPVEHLISTSSVSVGDVVSFGTYEQDGNTSNGAEDIEWLVLDVQGKQVLLVSRNGLDAQRYNEKYASTTWEQSTLRQWLNNDFLTNAFTAEEQQGILQTEISNTANTEYGTDGGNTTSDYVFCLSRDEADQYFESNYDRLCYPTDYALEQAVLWKNGGTTSDACIWWLRSPGCDNYYASYIDANGALDTTGDNVLDVSVIVRPAIWVDTSSL